MSIRSVSRRELNALLRRVAALPEVAKFEVFETLRVDLAATLNETEERNRLIAERQEAIEMIGKAAEHLGLEPGQAPTIAQFDEACKKLGLQWNSQRVIRAYERWRNATQAYIGRAPRETAAQRHLRRRRGFRTRSVDAYFEGVLKWLATCPERESMPAYNAWVTETNAKLGKNDPPYVLAQAIRTLTTLGWKNIVAVARDEKTLEDAAEEELAELLPPVSREAIIGLSLVAKTLGVSVQHAKALADGELRHQGFPTPVATIQGSRAWLVRDIRTYKRGGNFKRRTEGEMQLRFVEAPELEQRLGIDHPTLIRRIKNQRWDLVPQPEGYISKKTAYWRRSKVDKWFEARESV